jgi:hypothetical protein
VSLIPNIFIDLRETCTLSRGAIKGKDPDWIPDVQTEGLIITSGGKVKEVIVNAYFRDFQLGLGEAAKQYWCSKGRKRMPPTASNPFLLGVLALLLLPHKNLCSYLVRVSWAC